MRAKDMIGIFVKKKWLMMFCFYQIPEENGDTEEHI